jgi:pimeloyl-ACP methyl ester carboxylesterase
MATEERRLRLWQGRVETDVPIEGSGPAIVYLHGPWGLDPDRDFVAKLARSHTVYAPRHPGTTKGNPDAVHELSDWSDLVVYHGELLDALKLKSPAVVGHSFGALVAAELAAASPAVIGKMVLIDPVGLWRDDKPVKNWMILPDAERPKALFAKPDSAAAMKFFALPEDAAARGEALTVRIWAQACTGKFVWPIPDRGLKKRTHRIAVPTLIVWGRQDAIAAPDYAEEFKRRIAGSKVEMIDGAGHLPHLEQPDSVARAVEAFLT